MNPKELFGNKAIEFTETYFQVNRYGIKLLKRCFRESYITYILEQIGTMGFICFEWLTEGFLKAKEKNFWMSMRENEEDFFEKRN